MNGFTYGSLFSGIGGIDLGLDRAGMHCKWQVEIDSYAQKVLAKHWPDVARYGDIRTVGKHNLTPVDLIAGGFPCQDISISNTYKPQGINGQRSGLWGEFFRVVSELRPRYIIVENVPALRFRGLGRVLGDLAEIGYDAEWQMLPAAAFGAPHLRERLFIVAYSQQERRYIFQSSQVRACSKYPLWGESERPSRALALPRHRLAQLEARLGEPSVFGSDDGLSYWLDRLGTTGNAVVPQVAEFIGRCILASVESEAVS